MQLFEFRKPRGSPIPLIRVRSCSSRVWTIALRHGLITEDGHSYLGPGLVHEILEQAVTFCESIPAKDLDLGLDWAEKVYDMAMTALMVIRLGGDDKVFSNAGEKPWKSQMLPLVYRVLALFTKVRARSVMSIHEDI